MHASERELPLKALGERRIIQEVLSLFPSRSDQLPLGDDCGGVVLGSDYLLITTDSITAARHVPKGAKYRSVGWHIVAINLSDLAAKGATPLGFVIAYGLPVEFRLEDLLEIAEGINACAKATDTVLLGGDTKPNVQLTLTGTAVGMVPRAQYLPRSGMRNGDLVAVTGSLGRAGYGLACYDKKIDRERALELVLEVVPRLEEGRMLASSGAVTACMDLSDGLAMSLHQMKEMTDLGFCIEIDKVPIFTPVLHHGSELNIDPIELALFSGGDYELLFTIDPDRADEVMKIFSKHPVPVTIIGEVVENNRVLQRDRSGERSSLPKKGYEHFR